MRHPFPRFPLAVLLAAGAALTACQTASPPPPRVPWQPTYRLRNAGYLATQWSADGRKILVVGGGLGACVLDAQTGAVVFDGMRRHPHAATADMNADGTRLVLVESNGSGKTPGTVEKLILIDLDRPDRTLAECPLVPRLGTVEMVPGLCKVALADDGQAVFIKADGEIRRFELTRGRLKQTWTRPDHGINAIAFGQSGAMEWLSSRRTATPKDRAAGCATQTVERGVVDAATGDLRPQGAPLSGPVAGDPNAGTWNAPLFGWWTPQDLAGEWRWKYAASFRRHAASRDGQTTAAFTSTFGDDPAGRKVTLARAGKTAWSVPCRTAHGLSFSPDGAKLFFYEEDRDHNLRARLLDTATGGDLLPVPAAQTVRVHNVTTGRVHEEKTWAKPPPPPAAFPPSQQATRRLWDAVIHSQAAAARAAIKAGADVNAPGHSMNPAHETPLHWACRNRQKEMAQLLLAAGANANAVNDDKVPPLLQALSAGDLALAQMLAKAGANLHAADGTGYTALHRAAGAGSKDAVQWLLAQGADPKAKSVYQTQPAHFAAQGGDGGADCLRLLAEAGADLKAPDDNKRQPLHWAAGRQSAKTIRFLLDAGADLKAASTHGDQPIHEAARSGSAQGVAVLLAAGADVNATNRRRETPLHLAAGRRDADQGAVECLLKAGANPAAQNDDKQTPLESAKSRPWIQDNQKILRLLGEPAAAKP